MSVEKRLLTAEELVDYAALESTDALYQMLSRGEIPEICVIRLSPRRTRFDKAKIDQWIDSKKVAHGRAA